MNVDVRLRLDCRCLLGEGILWNEGYAELPSSGFLFVDVHGRRLHYFDVACSCHRSWEMPERIGWVIPSTRGTHLIAGFQSGIAQLFLEPSVRLEWMVRIFEREPALRLNDAKADSAGAIWTGSLNNDDEHQAVGLLFRLDPNEILTTYDAGYCVPNGPAINPEGTLMLHTDSVRRTIYAFDFNAGLAKLSNKRIWKTFAEEEGYPDGMAFDTAGNLWVALWGAGCVGCYSPSGKLLHRVQLPVSQVTNVAFGGERMERLFVTSGRVGLGSARLAVEPLAGGLFEIEAGDARGLPPHSFGR